MSSRQYSSDTINDLCAALAKAQGEIKPALKDTANPFFKSKYADLSACIDASRDALSKHGLSVVQMPDFDETGQWLVTQLSHSSGQWMRSYYPVRPVKPDPQALGSAVTYARRYAYCAITGVVAAGEDDDGNAASDKSDAPKPNAKQVYGTHKAMKDRYALIVEEIDKCDPSHESLKKVWDENNPHILAMKSMDEQIYSELVKNKDRRKKEITEHLVNEASFTQGFNGIHQ